MVSGLQFFERDPQYPTRNRGRGWYYFRGNLTTGLVGGARTRNPRGQRGPTWSFYSKNKTSGSNKDAKQGTQPRKVRKIEDKERLQPHKGDYKTRKAKSTDRRKVKAAGTGTGRTPAQRRANPAKYIKNRKTTRAGTGNRGFF